MACQEKSGVNRAFRVNNKFMLIDDTYNIFEVDGKTIIKNPFEIPSHAELRNLIGLCKKFIADNSDSDIERMNRDSRERKVKARFRDASDKNRGLKRPCFVYLMLNQSGAVKIGMTNHHPSFREATLQSQEPDVRLLCYFQGTKEDERRLHARFASQRIRGEWFNFNHDDLSFLIMELSKNTGYVSSY